MNTKNINKKIFENNFLQIFHKEKNKFLFISDKNNLSIILTSFRNIISSYLKGFSPVCCSIPGVNNIFENNSIFLEETIFFIERIKKINFNFNFNKDYKLIKDIKYLVLNIKLNEEKQYNSKDLFIDFESTNILNNLQLSNEDYNSIINFSNREIELFNINKSIDSTFKIVLYFNSGFTKYNINHNLHNNNIKKIFSNNYFYLDSSFSILNNFAFDIVEKTSVDENQNNYEIAHVELDIKYNDLDVSDLLLFFIKFFRLFFDNKIQMTDKENIVSDNLLKIINVNSNIFFTDNEEEMQKYLINKQNKKNKNFLEIFDLNKRVIKCLNGAGIIYLEDLSNFNKEEIFKIKYFGKDSLDNLLQIMKENNIKFKNQE